jgi:DNA-binding NarL/FixJ family response regulator
LEQGHGNHRFTVDEPVVFSRCRSIVLTSSDCPRERERAGQLAVNGYVRKPILLDEFIAVGGRIKSLLAGRSAAP